MCDTEAGYTIVAGPRGDLVWFVEFADTFELGRWGVEGIEFDDLARVNPSYGEPEVGAVAVVHHAPGDAVRVASGLNVAFRTGHRAARTARLMADPGHDFVAETAGPGGGGGGTPLLDPWQLQRAMAYVPSLGTVSGSRVALLDTGDAASPHDMIDLTHGSVQQHQPAADPHGHGTAVAETIHAVAPYADVHAIRVLGANAVGSSAAIYQGLILALWDAAGFDVVNASLGVDATTSCGTALASTFDYLVGLRAAAGGGPVLVAAAGNNRVSLRAPATATGATVVTAVDLTGAIPSYCASLRPAPGVRMVSAPGGTNADPLGRYADGSSIYGTSFAAGFATGALLP